MKTLKLTLFLFIGFCYPSFGQQCGMEGAAVEGGCVNNVPNDDFNNCDNPFMCDLLESNEFYIPDDDSPELTLNVNFHIMLHPDSENHPNFDITNTEHVAFLYDVANRAQNDIYRASFEEVCDYNSTGRFSIDSKINIVVKGIYDHVDEMGYTNNDELCGDYCYTKFVQGKPEYEDALNIFFIEYTGCGGGCGPALLGEQAAYATINESFTARYCSFCSYKEYPNLAHEIGHCLGLRHPNAFGPLQDCYEIAMEYGCPIPNPPTAVGGFNHLMHNESSLQKFINPLEAAQMRRYLLTTWRKKWLENYPDEVEVIEVSSPTIWEEDVTWYGDIVVHTGGELTVDNILRMRDDRRIFVERGGKLIIDGGMITSCGEDKWRGVLVEGAKGDKFEPSLVNGQLDDPFGPTDNTYAGTVIMMNGGTIDNAINGISSINRHKGYPLWTNFYGALIHCDGAIFSNCNRAVEIAPFGTPLVPDQSLFNNTLFSNMKKGVSVWNSDGVTFTQNEFIDIDGYGIHARNAAINVFDGNTFSNMNIGVELVGTKSNEISQKIGDKDTSPNVFDQGTYGVYINTVNNMTATTIVNNDFQTTVGVFVDGPSEVDCHNNDFSGVGQAFFAIDTDANPVSVSNNDFLGNSTAITAYFKNEFLTFTDNCMDGSVDDDVWIFGTAELPGQVNLDQGSLDFSAGNCFSQNSIPEIVTGGVTQSFTYFVETGTTTTSCFYPSTGGNFTINNNALQQHDSNCGTNGEGEPPVRIVCEPATNELDLRNEIQTLDEDIARLKSDRGDLSVINSKERCLNASLKALASLYAADLDYNTANIYFANRPEFDMRLIPFSNHLQEEKYLEARSYLNGLSTANQEEVDFKASQSIYLDFLVEEDYELENADRLYLIDTGEEAGPLNAYARSIFYEITEERIPVPIPAGGRTAIVEESRKNNNEPIKVFPNPLSSSNLMITGLENYEGAVMEIQDLYGRRVFSAKANERGKYNISLPLRGVYFITIYTNTETIHQEKLIILK